jgi:hypothetical protein
MDSNLFPPNSIKSTKVMSKFIALTLLEREKLQSLCVRMICAKILQIFWCMNAMHTFDFNLFLVSKSWDVTNKASSLKFVNSLTLEKLQCTSCWYHSLYIGIPCQEFFWNPPMSDSWTTITLIIPMIYSHTIPPWSFLMEFLTYCWGYRFYWSSRSAFSHLAIGLLP